MGTLHCLHHHSDDGVSMDMECHHNDNAQMFNYVYSSSGVSEIEEENSSELYETHHHDGHGSMATISEEQEDSVFVAVGKSETSMEALSWTLKNLATHSTMVYLIHVFPEVKHIPNPLGMGMIPKDQVSPEQVESYMALERGKRRGLLQKFLQSCFASDVKVDTILIESDLVAKAILDLIPILQIGKLVIGVNKFNLRKLRSRKGNGIADQILQNVPQGCKVRIISEGKEVNEQIMGSPCPQPQAPNPRASANDTSMTRKDEDHQNDAVSCICFKPKFK